jgi:hypothetical protein
LLAHELTHVVQQGQGDPHRKNIARKFISTIQSATPTIQRFFYVEGGAVHEVNNLARTVLYREDMGSTFALLNGIRIRQSADAKRALKKPTLDFSPVTTGGFDVRVKNVPVNKGSYDETVLSPGNWRLNVSKSTVFSKFPNLESCRNSGRTIFSALGYPSDIEIFQANRRHEDRHANDIASIFINTFYEWDRELDIAAAGSLKAATPYHGNTKQEAEAVLYREMGGTPDEIADKFTAASKKAQDDYHNLPEGGFAGWDPDTAKSDSNCSMSSVEVSNPS